MKEKETILIDTLRNMLKATMQKELEKLPKTLEALTPIERMNVVCKLMPFVFPKMEVTHSKEGEPLTW
jgi:hypothetical protein